MQFRLRLSHGNVKLEDARLLCIQWLLLNWIESIGFMIFVLDICVAFCSFYVHGLEDIKALFIFNGCS